MVLRDINNLRFLHPPVGEVGLDEAQVSDLIPARKEILSVLIRLSVII
jgi:hypothetical protein